MVIGDKWELYIPVSLALRCHALSCFVVLPRLCLLRSTRWAEKGEEIVCGVFVKRGPGSLCWAAVQ